MFATEFVALLVAAFSVLMSGQPAIDYWMQDQDLQVFEEEALAMPMDGDTFALIFDKTMLSIGKAELVCALPAGTAVDIIPMTDFYQERFDKANVSVVLVWDGKDCVGLALPDTLVPIGG